MVVPLGCGITAVVDTFPNADEVGITQSTRTEDRPSVLKENNLSGAINDGGTLRFVDLRSAIFDTTTDSLNTILDGTVEMTEALRIHMGNPSQWVKEPLKDREFYAR